MLRQSNTPLDAQKSITLKLNEPVVDPGNPWTDDLLARQDIAKRLTSLIENQDLPLTISLHGQWGTGKTFMLKRWQKDLEGQGLKAIYFNAWEDDFCDDPLVAILGHLSEYFKEDGLQSLADKIVKIALPLIRQNILGVLEKHTGVNLEIEQSDDARQDPLKIYLSQRTTKDDLKKHLTDMSAKVRNETGHPMVFIIDELDRCRPTFAIELLERVKHIFDAPNLVFVFGVNRDELCKSLSSVYGEINTDVYLRRFFDFEFNLSEVDSQSYAAHLFDEFQIAEVFRKLSEADGTQDFMNDSNNFRRVVPKLWNALGLSLRDIDYAIRLLALLARNVPLGTYTHPFLIPILIALKFKRPELYRALASGDFQTSKIMDYINEELRPNMIDEELSRYLDRSEGFLYCADEHNRGSKLSGETALAALGRVKEGVAGVNFRVLSQRAGNADQQQRDRICQAIYDGRQLHIDRRVFDNLATLIDTYHKQLRL